MVGDYLCVEPPRIIASESTQPTLSVREGEKVELVCNVTGTPPPTVTWYRLPSGLRQPTAKAGLQDAPMELEKIRKYLKRGT